MTIYRSLGTGRASVSSFPISPNRPVAHWIDSSTASCRPIWASLAPLKHNVWNLFEMLLSFSGLCYHRQVF